MENIRNYSLDNIIPFNLKKYHMKEGHINILWLQKLFQDATKYAYSTIIINHCLCYTHIGHIIEGTNLISSQPINHYIKGQSIQLSST